MPELGNRQRKAQPFKLSTRSLISPRMSRRRQILAAIFLSALTFTAFSLLPSPNLLFSKSGNFSGPLPDSSKVKIFMYDLPRKFTYGVVEKYLIARGTVKIGDDESMKYPGHQHSAEWWLFRDLIKNNRSTLSPVIRVFDPEKADLFYVPFFSSLSLVVNPIRPPVEVDVLKAASIYSDELMQEELVNWLENQEYWKRNGGRDHVFISQDPNALYKVIDRVRKSILLVSDFGRLRDDQASLVKDVILPYSHRINPFRGTVGVEERKSLLFFMGNRYRKEGGKIRDALFQVLESESDVVIKHGTQSRESRRMATQGMHSSKFCLHPAGDTPSACRLFDAIVSLCIPVIVSDDIELPFEDTLDYKKFAIFVDSKSAVEPGFLTKYLRDVKMERVLEYQRTLKSVQRYFEYEDPNGTVQEIWRQAASKLPLIRLMIHRDKRLVPRVSGSLSCIVSN